MLSLLMQCFGVIQVKVHVRYLNCSKKFLCTLSGEPKMSDFLVQLCTLLGHLVKIYIKSYLKLFSNSRYILMKGKET